MSKGEKLPLIEMLFQARKIAAQLKSAGCQRAEIAGSLRRKCATASDIEIVCIPKMVEDLFGQDTYLWGDVQDALAMYPMLKGGDRYQQYELGFCKLDLYATTREQWGVIFTLRTGSARFSRKLVTPQSQGGYMPEGLWIEEGRLWKGGVAMETPREEDLFRGMGLTWIPPERR